MSGEILKKTRRLIRLSDSRDPFKIAQAVGVEVFIKPLGNLKGMYTCIKRNRFIVLSDTLNEHMQRMVCAHELGHDQLHRALATNTFLREYRFTPMDAQPEREANAFAAELLLPDDEVLDLARESVSLEQAAKLLCTDKNLVALKIEMLRRKGYGVYAPEVRSAFLKF